MEVFFLTAFACLHLIVRLTRGEDNTLIWIQHPDVPDYYEHLLGESVKCKKAQVSNAAKFFKRIMSIGSFSKETQKKPSPQSDASTSPKLHKSKSSNCRTTQSATNEKAFKRALSFSDRRSNLSYERLPQEESYRFLRSSSSGRNLEKSLSRSSSRRDSFFFFQTNGCSLHGTSVLKHMETVEKQKLCDADLILFSTPEDENNFPNLLDESAINSSKEALELRAMANWPMEKAMRVHPILFRQLFDIKQNFMDNLPKKKKKKGFLSGYAKKKGKKSNKVSSKRKKDYVKLFIEKSLGFEKTEAIPCIVYENMSWFIIDGFAIDQYFTVEKIAEGGENYKVTGLLEPMAEIDQRYSALPPIRLERHFIEMQKWIVNSKSRVNLCLLDDIHKFRLCSSVYAAWQRHQKIPNRRWNVTQIFEPNVCIENITLKSRDEKTHSITHVPVTLLPCSVNNIQPAFYITANEGGQSVFIVTSDDNNNDFFLSLLVLRIAALRSIQIDDLIEDYDPSSSSRTSSD